MNQQIQQLGIGRPSNGFILRALESLPVFPKKLDVDVGIPINAVKGDISPEYEEKGVIPGFKINFRYDDNSKCFIPYYNQSFYWADFPKQIFLESFVRGGKPEKIGFFYGGRSSSHEEEAHKCFVRSVQGALTNGYCFDRVLLEFDLANRNQACLRFDRCDRVPSLEIDNNGLENEVLNDWFKRLTQN